MMRKKIAVAMSGGVDSSLAAALLKEAGHDVLGITLRLWGEERDSEQAIASSKAVCKTIGIDHKILDLRESFKKEIIDNFIGQYVSGLTPNPCVRCNELIKFGILMKLADLFRAEWLATGHYARVMINGQSGRYNLLTAMDGNKDQSYFMYRLSQRQLGMARFPLGEMTKEEVRIRAREMGLPSAGNEESQEVCFIPDNDYRGFIEAEMPDAVREGNFVDTKGNVLGSHRGIAFYTVGQRKGLGVSSPLGRRYVLDRDTATNRVVLGDEEELKKPDCLVADTNWIRMEAPTEVFEADVKLRYRFKPVRATLIPEEGGVRIRFKTPESGVSPGQSAVFYDGDAVVGGGIIQKEK